MPRKNLLELTAEPAARGFRLSAIAGALTTNRAVSAVLLGAAALPAVAGVATTAHAASPIHVPATNEVAAGELTALSSRTLFGAGATASAPGVALSDDGQVFLSASGHLVPSASKDAPSNALELGETLLHASMLAEEGHSLFSSERGISLDQRSKLLDNLVAAFEAASPERAPATGYQTKDQALQVRSSVTPLLIDLLKTTSTATPAGRELRARAASELMRLVETEPHGLNRNFMIYDLHVAKKDLPIAMLPALDTLMREVAPLSPPYEEWFKNGNKTVSIDYHVGDGFWDSELAFFTNEGFTRTNNADGTVLMKKSFAHENEGEAGHVRFETEIAIRMHDGSSGLFSKMNDPSTHMVVYSGHANYGREVPSRLSSGTDQKGAKVFVALKCGGKGTHNAVLERYPDLQVVSTKNSSYETEDRATMRNIIRGIVERGSWESISKANRDGNSDNYYFPTDTLIAKRASDRDHDGRVDSWDRVVNYDSFRAQSEVDEQLLPKDPKKASYKLDGRAIHGALLRFHRMAGYNYWATHWKDQGVLNAGYFDGKATDPLFRADKLTGEDGEELLRVRINKHYAHASEETLGAVLHYELGRTAAAQKGLDAADSKAAGLLMASKCLDVDNGYLDEQIWRALLHYANLPSKIDFHEVHSAAASDEAWGAGSRKALDTVKEYFEREGIQLELAPPAASDPMRDRVSRSMRARLDVIAPERLAELDGKIAALASDDFDVWRDARSIHEDGTITMLLDSAKTAEQPFAAGSLPRTWSSDGAPLEALMLGVEGRAGELVRGKAIGIAYAVDERGWDPRVVISAVGADGEPTHTLDAAGKASITEALKGRTRGGPASFTRVVGFGDAADAMRTAKLSSRTFERALESSPVAPIAGLDASRPVRVLVTGFEPWDARSKNMSGEVARELAASPISGVKIEKLILPVEYESAAAKLLEAVERIKPDLVIELGESSAVKYVDIERRANNNNGGLADNAGVSRSGAIVEGAPSHFDTKLDVRELQNRTAASGLGLEARADDSGAGAFICNEVYFRVMNALKDRNTAVLMVHMPTTSGSPVAPVVESVRSLVKGAAAMTRPAPAPATQPAPARIG